MINFDYVKPGSQQGVMAVLGKDAGAQVIAGGTNLVDLMKRYVATPPKLVDITGLPLRSISKKADSIRIEALALNSAVAEHPLVIEHLPLLSKALQAGASPQIRNMATVGGNMMQRTRCGYFYDTTMPCNKRSPGTGCAALNGYNRMHAIVGASNNCIAVHPSDMCVALAALDAVVIVNSAKGNRRIPFADFHRLPGTTPDKDNNLQKGELIVAIEVPVQRGLQAKTHYTKVRDRSSYAFALVSVAAAMELSGNAISQVRLAMGGVAHKPWRLNAAEQFLKGKAPTLANFKQAAALEFAAAKGYGHNNFKLQLAPNSIVHSLQTLAGI